MKHGISLQALTMPAVCFLHQHTLGMTFDLLPFRLAARTGTEK